MRVLRASNVSGRGTFETCRLHRAMSASLIGRLGSSTFRLSTTIAVSMSLRPCESRSLSIRPMRQIRATCRSNLPFALLFEEGSD